MTIPIRIKTFHLDLYIIISRAWAAQVSLDSHVLLLLDHNQLFFSMDKILGYISAVELSSCSPNHREKRVLLRAPGK